MNAIILYYSKSGTTEKPAERICKDLRCGKIRIEPEQEYGSYFSAIARVTKSCYSRLCHGNPRSDSI